MHSISMLMLMLRSGIFGMAAGLILISILVATMAQPAAVDRTMMAIAIAASIAGTTVAIREALSERSFRVWAARIINSVSGYDVLERSDRPLAPALRGLP